MKIASTHVANPLAFIAGAAWLFLESGTLLQRVADGLGVSSS